MTKTWARAAVLAAFLLCLSTQSRAQAALPQAVRNFPDYLAVRSEFLSALVTAPAATALNFKAAYRDTPAGRLRVSVENAGAYFYILFQFQAEDGAYPYAGRGNIIVRRDAATGYLSQIKWFLSDDGLSWVSLAPKNERTLLDYVVAGTVMKSGVTLPNILYYFLMNDFSYLYRAAGPSVDWSLVLGAPGPAKAADFSAGIASPGPTKAQAAFLKAVADFSSIGGYLELAGRPEALPEEETKPAGERAAAPADVRESGPYRPFSPWNPETGLPLAAATATVLSRSAEGCAYIVYVDGDGLRPPLKLALVAYWKQDGSYVLNAWDAATKRPADWQRLVAARPDSRARLYRLPLPRD